MAQEIQIRVKQDQIRFIYSDDLLNFLNHGQAKVKRASHVESSSNGWIADLSPVLGPILGPFLRKSEALKAEVDWLNTHKIPQPL